MVAAPNQPGVLVAGPRRCRMRIGGEKRVRRFEIPDAIWISSTARNENVEIPGHRPSTVETQEPPGFFGLIFSSPVISANGFSTPAAVDHLVVDLRAASSRSGRPITPEGMRQHPLDGENGSLPVVWSGPQATAVNAGAGSPFHAWAWDGGGEKPYFLQVFS